MRETITIRQDPQGRGERGERGTRMGGRKSVEEWKTDGDSERTITMKHHTWFSTYFVFIVNLSTRINKQFNHICLASVRSMMKSCLTIL